MFKTLFVLLFSWLLPLHCMAEAETSPEPRTGPVIEAYGPTFAVPEGSLNLEADRVYRVVMDVGDGPEDPQTLNRGIESAARFLNLHARHGIRAENMKMAVVLHGGAARAALRQEAYEQRHRVPNPDAGLIAALGKAGVEIYLCGQSAAYRGFKKEELLPQVSLALSAMTVHVRLQQEGYRAILF